MKDTKQIRKVLFVGKSNVALIVIENVDNNNNILFANQVSVDEENLQVKISELVTNAANFLGFNIKDVEMIFEDSQIQKQDLINKEFYDCENEEDISKEIFKLAKINNWFVNEINFMGIVYDDVEKMAKVNCQLVTSQYITYKKYLNAVKKCNLSINHSFNLYKLIKANKNQIELSLSINDDNVVACEYYGGKLNNVKNIKLNMEEIKQHVTDTFKINLNKVNDVLQVANQLLVGNETDVLVANNYDLKTKSFNNVKVSDIVALYRELIQAQINKVVDCCNFQSVHVISNDPINHLDGFDFVQNSEIGFDNISIAKLVCLANIDAVKEIDQFSFENRIKAMNLLA